MLESGFNPRALTMRERGECGNSCPKRGGDTPTGAGRLMNGLDQEKASLARRHDHLVKELIGIFGGRRFP